MRLFDENDNRSEGAYRGCGGSPSFVGNMTYYLPSCSKKGYFLMEFFSDDMKSLLISQQNQE